MVDKTYIDGEHVETPAIDTESASISDFNGRIASTVTGHHRYVNSDTVDSNDNRRMPLPAASSVTPNFRSTNRTNYGTTYVTDDRIWRHNPRTGQVELIADNQPDGDSFVHAAPNHLGDWLVIAEDGTDADGNISYKAMLYIFTDIDQIGDSTAAHRDMTGIGRPRAYGIYPSFDGDNFVFAEYSGTSTNRVIEYDRSAGQFNVAMTANGDHHLHRISQDPINKNMYVIDAHTTFDLWKSTDGGSSWSIATSGREQQEIGRVYHEDGYAYWGTDEVWEESDGMKYARMYRAPLNDIGSVELLGKFPDPGMLVYGNSLSYNPEGVLMAGSVNANQTGADGSKAPLWFWSFEIQREVGVGNITIEDPEPLIRLDEQPVANNADTSSFGFRDMPQRMNEEVGGFVVRTRGLKKHGDRNLVNAIVKLQRLQAYRQL